jgi:hypothetical protein
LFKQNFKIEYGTHFKKKHVEIEPEEIIFIPDTDHERTKLFGDPCPGEVKCIFINGTVYPHFSKIYIYSMIDIYRVDTLPGKN